MKSPFKPKSSSGFYIALFTSGAIAAGIFVLTWLSLKAKSGEPQLEDIDYLDRKKNKGKKKSRTDVHQLHHLVPGSHDEHKNE